jgi:nucleoside-diphosphate-sugar epimerase
MRVFATGGTGMIGRHLVRRLLRDGHDVWGLTRRAAAADPSEEPGGGCVTWVVGDVRDAASVAQAVRQADPELVYHLASTPFNPPTIPANEHLDTIVGGMSHLLEALKDRRGLRVVIAGSAAEYGAGSGLREDGPAWPGTVLGAAKLSATLLAQTYGSLHGLRTRVLRIFTPFGPGEAPTRLIPHVIHAALAGRDVRMTSGAQQRDYFYIDDLVEALILAGARDVAPGAILNACSGQPRAVRDAAARVLALMGDPVKLEAGALPTRPDELMELSGDPARARELLGWTPTVPFDEGLRRTIAWVAERAGREEGAALAAHRA